MKWEDVCQAFREQWVLIEAVQAYTNEKSERILHTVIVTVRSIWSRLMTGGRFSCLHFPMRGWLE